MSGQSGFDHVADVVVVGSGAGAMAAAIRAHDLGAKTLILEKSDLYGGSSAMSGGALWIPNNHLMRAAGIDDSREDALTYLKAITRGEVPEQRLQAYVDKAPEMLEYMTSNTRLEMIVMPEYPDYYPRVAGSRPGGRTVEPVRFDARLLGDEFKRLRPPAYQELILGRIAMTATEARDMLARRPGWVTLSMKIFARYWFDIGGRLQGKRDRSLTLGNALVGRLRLSLMDRRIPLWLSTPVRDLIVE
ncbi:MAG: FAD-binding protein, partial [Candidatus Dadabacteria bacterium]